MNTIPDDINAMVDLLVKNELIRIAPVVCKQCTPEQKCWFCAPPHSQSVRREAGE